MLRKAREDRAALVGRLYDAHGAALYRYALMLLADHAAAEDAVQQVFTTLLRHRAEIADEARYLRRSIRNECYSALRRQKRMARDDRPLLDAAEGATVGAEERLALQAVIAGLPPEQREVIHLHVFEGMTFVEAAEASGESMNTIASRYRYAIAKLRAALRRHPE